MIITRYLFKEVLSTMIVVLGILLLIFLSNEFVRYLTVAAAGKISGMTVLKIMAMQVPYLAGLLLPASLFMGFLLAYGRMYAESEMTVLIACGMSLGALLRISFGMASIILVIDIILTFYVSPFLLNYKNHLQAVAGPATLVETLQPGRFTTSPDGNIVYYIQTVSRDHRFMYNIFMAQRDKGSVQAKAPGGDSWNVTSATSGYTQLNNGNNEQWLVAEKGYRYFGEPGELQFKTIEFAEFHARMGTVVNPQKHAYEGMPTSELWQHRNDSPKAQAEWQWRISLPLSIPILTLLAIPLSYVRPREGRYAKLLPAILVYAAYANMMFVARNWVSEQKVSADVGMWWLHITLLCVALGLWCNRQWLKRYIFAFCRLQ
ncbi:MAG: LPS export ABC transporter permease LptF [Legionellales bacterium]|nr:LPS export ABC transporter permease LptF [Legionellales bacterium]